MVALDVGDAALERDRLDHVGVERALRQELRRRHASRASLLEDLDEGAADDLALLLGVRRRPRARRGNARSRRRRAGRSCAAARGRSPRPARLLARAAGRCRRRRR